MANVPKDLKYTREHEWAKQEGDRVRVGITAYAQAKKLFESDPHVLVHMENGAGSVGESARPALPKTRSTSGNVRRIRSWIWRMRPASVTDIPGSAVGMYR